MEFRTRPFRLTQLELVRMISLAYVRGFWWIIVGIPIFGILGLIWAPNRPIVAFSFLCVLWPVSIPARAILFSRKAAKMYREETVAMIQDGELRMVRPSGQGTKMDLASVWQVDDLAWCLIVRTRKMATLIIPSRAFETRDEQTAFAKALKPPRPVP